MTARQAKAITLPILARQCCVRPANGGAGHRPAIDGRWGPVFERPEDAKEWVKNEFHRLHSEGRSDVIKAMIHTGWFDNLPFGSIAHE